jgi:hypothetical protein
MFEDIIVAISDFRPITLAEMDSVKLLDRTDTKFIFPVSKLPGVLALIREHYRVLEVEDTRITDYETLYYDTPDWELYTRHHNQKLNRYKVRFRKYVNSNLHFFEVKYKNNKGRTIKSRVKRPAIETTIIDKAKMLLEQNTTLLSNQLVPALWVNYSRITFVNNNLEERLTIDLALTFKKDGMEKKFDTLVIAELKQDRARSRSVFLKAMNHYRIKQNSISKYCLGVTQLVPNIKKNNFKPKVLTLNKILYALPHSA